MAKHEVFPNKPNLELQQLYQIVPLKTPLGIIISPCSNLCDFDCIYCDRNRNDKPTMLDMDKFLILADQIEQFGEPVKQINFCGDGETILNPNLPDMIAEVKKRNLAKQVKINTNANQLTNEYADRLIDSGLDILKVSLQGLSSEKYLEICRTKVDFNKFREQLRYFYNNRKNCLLHIKIIDIALEDGEEEIFYKIFDDCADSVFIEKCFGEYAKNDTISKYDFDMSNMRICPSPFYTLLIDDLGNVFPCCRLGRYEDNVTLMGNIFHKTIKEIWNDEFYKMQKDFLKGDIDKYFSCRGCKRFIEIGRPQDVLDGYEDEILNRMENSIYPLEKMR